MILVAFLLAICLALLSFMLAIKHKSAKKLSLANDKLEIAIVKADRANDAKSQFLAQMSHEIRTPMNAIIGLTEIAKTEVRNPEKTYDYLGKIDASSRLLLGVINDVLDMSAIEGGKLKIDNAAFNFKKMLTDITTVFHQQASQKDIDFQVHLRGVSEESLIGDELRVKQILINLLSNAVKFTPSGGKISLTVLEASHSQDKVQFRFSVADTGCGMNDDMKARLFKPFEQESASTARKHGGSGLGLSISKNLAEMMQGSINVESKLGEGSVFYVDIPFGISEEKLVFKPESFVDIRTLVVDDNEESCEYCGILLSNLGVPYDYVTDAEAALEKLGEAEDKGNPFKLCLIDWKMPGMDGLELTGKIREVFGDEAMVIIVSAYDLNEIETRRENSGVNYYIPKPLFKSTLFDALMRISGNFYSEMDAGMEKDNFDFIGKKVLVVEDVDLNMEVAVSMLEMVGVSTESAVDGRQAVEMFEASEEDSFDCILMDINMPVMDGYEAAKAIRRLSREDAKTIPIYAMTANAFSEDVTRALNAGMNGHIAKPVDAKTLYNTLEKAFENKE